MSIFCSLAAGVILGICLPIPLFVYEFRQERKTVEQGAFITLTPFKQRRTLKGPVEKLDEDVGFDARESNYLKIAEVLVTLASASLAVFITHPALLPRGHVPSFLEGTALVLLAFSVLYGLAFMAAMTYFHEMFVFDPRSFTAFRSSLMFTLGFGAFECFGVSYLLLATVVAAMLASR
jgi:hypothetical protein